MVEAVMDDGVEAKSLGEQAWRGPGYEGFDRLDDQIEAQLLAALGPEWFEELPRRLAHVVGVADAHARVGVPRDAGGAVDVLPLGAERVLDALPIGPARVALKLV